MLIKIRKFSFTKTCLKISSAKWRPFCPGGEELNPVSAAITAEHEYLLSYKAEYLSWKLIYIYIYAIRMEYCCFVYSPPCDVSVHRYFFWKKRIGHVTMDFLHIKFINLTKNNLPECFTLRKLFSLVGFCCRGGTTCLQYGDSLLDMWNGRFIDKFCACPRHCSYHDVLPDMLHFIEIRNVRNISQQCSLILKRISQDSTYLPIW